MATAAAAAAAAGGNGDDTAPLTCAICFDDAPTELVRSVAPAQSEQWQNKQMCKGAHVFCAGCLATWAQSHLAEQRPHFACPAPGCTVPMLPDDVERVCGGDQGPAAHATMVALLSRDFGARAAEMQQDAGLQEWLAASKVRQCPTCHLHIERSAGCPHMVCICGTGFCYDCGGRIEDCGGACQYRYREPPSAASLARCSNCGVAHYYCTCNGLRVPAAPSAGRNRAAAAAGCQTCGCARVNAWRTDQPHGAAGAASWRGAAAEPGTLGIRRDDRGPLAERARGRAVRRACLCDTCTAGGCVYEHLAAAAGGSANQ